MTSSAPPPVRAALTAGFDLDAERLARSRRMAEDLGLPERVVREAPDTAEAELAARRIEENPLFAKWAAEDEANAALARDDLQGFSDLFAWLGRKWDANLEAAGAAWDSGEDNFAVADLGNRWLDRGDESARAELEAVYGRQAGRQKALENRSFVADYMREAIQQGPQFLAIQIPSYTEGMGMALAVEGAGIALGASVGGAGGATVGSVAPVAGTAVGGAAGAAGGGLVGGIASLPAAVTAFSVTSAVRSGQRMYDLERGMFAAEMMRMRDVDGKPVERETVRAAATVYGAAAGALEGGGELLFLGALKFAGKGGEAVAERLGAAGVKQGIKAALVRLASTPAGRSRLAKIALAVPGGASIEGMTEGLQEFAAVIAENLALDAEEAGGEKFFAERAEIFSAENMARIGEAALGGFKAGLWLRGAPVAVSRLFDPAPAKAAQTFAERQGELFDRVEALKLKELSPEMTRDLLEANGVNGTVLLPAAEALELAQSDAALWSALGVSEISAREAVALGRDLEVDNAIIVGRLSREQFDKVRPLLRENHEAPTLAETEAREARLQEDVGRVLEAQRGAEARRAAVERLYGRLEEQIARAVAETPGLQAQAEGREGGARGYVAAHMQTIRAFVERVGVSEGDKAGMLARLTVQSEMGEKLGLDPLPWTEHQAQAEAAARQESPESAPQEPAPLPDTNDLLPLYWNPEEGAPGAERRAEPEFVAAQAAEAARVRREQGRTYKDRDPVLRAVWGSIDGKSLKRDYPTAYAEIVKNHGIGVFRKNGTPIDVAADDLVRANIFQEGMGADDLVEHLKRPREEFRLFQGDSRTAVVVDVDPSVIPVDLKNTAALREWLQSAYQGREVVVADDGNSVRFTGRGLRASAKRRGEAQRQAYAAIDKALEGALYDSFEKADAAHPTVHGQRVYYAALRIGEELFAVKFKVDAQKAGDLTYKDHKVTEIEIAPALYQRLYPQGDTDSATPGAIYTISIDILKGEVKPSGIQDGVLFQKNHSAAQRGSFVRSANGFTITLSERADLSTLAHESGHWFREELRRVVESGLADERLARDFALMEKKLGRFDDPALLKAEYDRHLKGQFGGRAFSRLDEAAKARVKEMAKHEYFARSFEAYLFEGRTPDRELAGAFARFKRWLTSIYRDTRRLGVELDDEVRGFFDRLLATEQRIEETAAANELFALTEKELDALEVSGPDRTYAAGLMEAAKAGAVEKLQRLLDFGRNARRAAWAEEARAGLLADPVYAARAAMRGEGALDPELTAGLYGAEIVAAVRKTAGPGAFRKGGADPELFAAEHGFASGAELLAKIARAEPLGRAIKRYVQAKEAEHDAGLDPAPHLLATEEAGRQTELVGQYLARHLGRDHIQQEAFRRVAEKKIETLPMKEAQAGAGHLAAMRRALRRERLAIARGDFAAALEANAQSRLNMELARLAGEAAELAGRTEKEIRRFIGRKIVNPEARFAVMDIAMRHGLAKFDERLAAGRDVSSIRNWIAGVEEDGFTLFVDDAVVYGPGGDWREMPLAKFRDLAETTAQIRAVERNGRKLLAAGDKANFRAAVEGAVNTIFRFRKARPLKTVEERGLFARGLAEIHAMHTKIEALCLALDGDNPLGDNWSLVYRPINEAENRRGVMFKELAERLRGAELFGAYSDRELSAMSRKKEYVPEIGESLTKGQRLMAALNMGNEGNMQRLLNGHGWTPEQAQAVVAPLSARDWTFVQGIWDTFESYKEAAFTLQEQVCGLRPSEVAARPLSTPAGELRGGYFPVVYDARAARVDLQEKIIANDNPAFAMTRHGHLKERTAGGAGTPLDLNLSVIPARLNDVITDLCFRKAYIDVGRVLRDKEYRRAIESTVGRAQYQGMVAWLKDAAKESNPRAPGESMARWARASATMMSMGYKFTTMLTQPFGLTQSMELIGTTNTLKGLYMAYGKGPKGMLEMKRWVRGVSPMMDTRIKSFDREVADAANDFARAGLTPDSLFTELTTRVGLRRVEKWFKENAFVPMGVVQFGVDLPTWLGAYQKGIRDFAGDEAKAIAYADSAVRLSQGSGQAKDLARVQRGGQYHKLFTMFYSYFSTLYNLTARRMGDPGMKLDAASVKKASLSFLLLYVLPATLSEIAAGRGPDEDEDYLAWSAKQVAMYPMQTVAGLRSVAGIVEAEYGFKASPAEDSIGTLYNWGCAVQKALTDDEYELDGKKFARLSTRALGYFGALPVGQAEISAFNVWDYLDGTSGDFELRDLLFRRPKSRR